MKKLTVTIGIPAYNETHNLGKLIADIFTQKQKSWILDEIIVVNDASTDATAELLNSLPSPKITVLAHAKRSGKSQCLNDIFRHFDSHVLILFDADERLHSHLVIEKFVEVFRVRPTVMLLSGDKRPVKPRSFLERGIYATYKIFHESKLRLKGGNNIFGCQGGCIGLQRSFAKSLHLPHIISEDAYMYLECKKRNLTFHYVDNIAVYYKQANTLTDYLRQLFRSTPESVEIFLKKYFGNQVQSEFARPWPFLVAATVSVILDDPLPALFIVCLQLLVRPLIPVMTKKYRVYWPVAVSTK